MLVVADPKTMGRLRQQLQKGVSGKIADAVSLDLVRLPLPQLETRLRDVLGWAA